MTGIDSTSQAKSYCIHHFLYSVRPLQLPITPPRMAALDLHLYLHSRYRSGIGR
ncbi:hypothetical protein FFLO_05540 [Filobasidium floriforme]|uniref:Uncharacterized protein n=1 Tax=Filobasidium floriforme TaxID=5210 RepID=A0A8K0NRA5_9TREE|nr:hypothetical protein FFLO_05540 [Filobasidium floriforme]